jgi:hypothetical protein
MLEIPQVVWVPADILKSADVTDTELPLYLPEGAPGGSHMHVNNERARAAGLILTAPLVSLRSVQEWVRGQDVRMTLTPEREAELIRLARERKNPTPRS